MVGFILGGGLAIVVSLALTPLVRDAMRYWGFVDRPDRIRKLHEGAIPHLGGVAILLSYALVLGLLKLGVVNDSSPQFSWLAIAAVAVVFGTGLIDDLAGLTARQKLLGQFAGAIMAWWSGV